MDRNAENRFYELQAEQERILGQLKGSGSPVEAAKNAFDLFIFAFYLFGSVQAGRITSDNFVDPLRIHTETSVLRFDKTYTPLELHATAANLLLVAEGAAAIITDSAMEALGERNADDPSDLGAARSIIYCIRNAFAHSPLRPIWRIDPRYRRLYKATSIEVEFNGQACNEQQLKAEHYGGLEGYIRLLGFCLNALR